jgi:hypothetical protein
MISPHLFNQQAWRSHNSTSALKPSGAASRCTAEWLLSGFDNWTPNVRSWPAVARHPLTGPYSRQPRSPRPTIQTRATHATHRLGDFVLQVLGADLVWHDVRPSEGALLVNLGDVTARWTNDQWLSTLHRVRPPVVDGVIRRRRSAAYFHDGNIDAVITTLPSCVGADGSRYPPITIGEHLTTKLASSRAGKVNTEAGPEASRARSATG